MAVDGKELQARRDEGRCLKCGTSEVLRDAVTKRAYDYCQSCGKKPKAIREPRRNVKAEGLANLERLTRE